MKQEPIIFRSGEENGIVIERENFKSSIFVDQYQQAIDLFARLWERQKSFQVQTEDHKTKVYGIDNQFSNIIAFCGDRGEGKTSSMISFATLLTDNDVREKAKEALVYPLDNSGKEMLLSPSEIEWLDVIDPSFFDKQHNLLELMLGQMYAKASEISTQSNESQKNEYAYKRRKLMEQFQIVKNSTHLLECDDKLYDSISEMSDLSASIQLKSDIQKLFRCYLDYINKKCLLICIDDIDLNVKDAYQMSEMLRKYFISPYCIVLVAVKVEQLVEVISKHHEDVFKLSQESSLQIARKYVTKLLPRGNRIALPTAEEFSERLIHIEDANGKIDSNEPDYTIKEKVVQMIFQKTGYVFYNTQHLSPIIPRNLRSLRHLLGLLYPLPDARDESWNDNETGREVFKDYFFGTWVENNLSSADYKFAQQLAEYDDLSTMNAFVIEHFAKRVKDYGIKMDATDIEGDYESLYRDITSNKNTSTNLSYGDVMYILWLINGITLNIDIQNLIFFIKTVYSMRLYACYNDISQGLESMFPPTPNVEKTVHIHKAETLYANANKLQRLVNGSYFTYPQGTLLPQKDNKYPRDRVVIKIENLKSLYNDLFDKEKENQFLENLQLCEYMALCISRTTTNKEQIKDLGLNRKDKIPTYLGMLSTTAEYVVFDFLQPFYSLSNIDYAYKRFDEIALESKKNSGQQTLYSLATTTKDSLYKKFLGQSTKRVKKDNWDYMHHLISDAVIRVTDVQWAIFEELLRTRNLHKSGNLSIPNAYEDIQKLKIKLYPLIRKDNPQKDGWILKMEFLTVLKDFLANANQELINATLYPIDERPQNDIEEIIRKAILDLSTQKMFPRSGLSISTLLSRAIIPDDKNKRRKFAKGLYSIFEKQQQYTSKDVINNILNVYKAYYITQD